MSGDTLQTAERTLDVLALFLQGGDFTAPEISAKLNLPKSRSTVYRLLTSLRNKNVIEIVDESRSAYQLTDEFWETLRRGASRHAQESARRRIEDRTQEIVRAVDVQARHLMNEMLNILR